MAATAWPTSCTHGGALGRNPLLCRDCGRDAHEGECAVDTPHIAGRPARAPYWAQQAPPEEGGPLAPKARFLP